MAYQEDSPSMEMPPPRGILSGETQPTMGLEMMGENMVKDGDASDAEYVHAETNMEAIKAGDTEAYRDSLAAFVRECIRNYERGKKGKPTE